MNFAAGITAKGLEFVDLLRSNGKGALVVCCIFPCGILPAKLKGCFFESQFFSHELHI